MRNTRETITIADTSGDTNCAAINASYLLSCSAQVVQSGSSTGVVKFQASNDPLTNAGNASATNWTDIASQTVTISSASTFLIPKFEISYQWVRLVYTHTNGSAGSAVISFNALGF